jgi:hypothetical protein
MLYIRGSVHHDGYTDLFREAEEKSRRWGVQMGPAFTTPAGHETASAYDALPTIGRIVDSREFSVWESLEIRLHCAEIHLSIFANQHHWQGPCVLTIGDVEVDGQREYGTAYPQLRQEMRGERRGTSETYPCHVWLTFADMHVVDVTFFPYRYYDRVPNPWQWSRYVLCSDPRHPLAADLPLRYLPMLVGLNAVQALIA